ncbi:MAG: hypothetical protein ACJAV7_002862 [Flavobacteriales bacterium]|jgi:hypothetical protein
MSLRRKFKSFTRSFLMKREAEVSRHRKGSNFGEAQSVAVVYNESDENHFKKVKSFVKFLHDEHGIRKIMAFGYSDADPKNLPHWLSHKLEFDFFTEDDIAWNLHPSQHVKTFTQQEFDILIDASNLDCIPLQYVVAKSKARMKVGNMGGHKKKHYDLMINMEPFDFDKYLEQVNIYLTNMKLQ